MTGAEAAVSVAGVQRPAPVVALRDVGVRFPRRADPVLDGVTLRLSPGEQVVVLGPSGSGKSTVLSTITGVVPHAVHGTLTGEVQVAGTTTAQTSVVERSRHLGALGQDPAASVCLPVVEQEVALPLENHAVPQADIGPRVTSALAAVGAQHLRTRGTQTLSGGEAQRVALAAALVTEPAVLLLDEPTSMLDPAGLADVRTAVTSAVARHRPAVVLVEHRLDEWAGASGTAGLPPRALVLDHRGSVLADGATDVVLRKHAAELHAAGCWLPLDAELLALGGVPGGLAAEANRALLRAMAADATVGAVPDRGAPPVLTAQGLAVGRGTSPAGRGRARRRAATSATAAPVLAEVDLTVRSGEVVALLGANGVGKTTLLLTLAGLLQPLAGRVHAPPAGLVFQNPEHQFLAHTVAREIAHGLPAAAAEAIVTRQLRRHRLEHLADQSPFRLSGGEKRRLSLAAMLAHDRAVLLADEPTLGLDRRDAIATVSTLRQVADAGAAVVLSSHDLRTVATCADRVVVLGEGGVLADGNTGVVLRDVDVLRRAPITLPPLVAWLLGDVGAHGMRQVLSRLDGTVAAASAGGAG